MIVLHNVIVLLPLLVCVHVEAAHDYRIRFERFEVSDLDPEYITSKAWTSKINRTEFGANAYFNILKQCPLDAIVQLKCFEFLNNEYRPFAISLKKRVCDYLENEYKMFFYAKMPDMFPPKCPLGPGNYTMTNYIVQTHRLPATLPFKKMLLEIKFITGQRTLITIHAYAKFDRDIVIRERYSKK